MPSRSGLSVSISRSACVPSTARRSPPRSSTTFCMRVHAGKRYVTRTFFTPGRSSTRILKWRDLQRPGLDVVLDIFRKTREDELEAGSIRLAGCMGT